MDFEPVAWSHPLYIKSPMFSPHHWISDLLSLLKLTIYLQWFCKWMSNWGGSPSLTEVLKNTNPHFNSRQKKCKLVNLPNKPFIQ